MIANLRQKKSILGVFFLQIVIFSGCGMVEQKPIRTGSSVIEASKEKQVFQPSYNENEEKQQEQKHSHSSFDELVIMNRQIAAIKKEIESLNEQMSSQVLQQEDIDKRISKLETDMEEKEKQIDAIDMRLQSIEGQVEIIAALETALVTLEQRIDSIEITAVKRAEFEALKYQVEELSESKSGTVAIIKSVVSGLTLIANEMGFPIAELIIGS